MVFFLFEMSKVNINNNDQHFVVVVAILVVIPFRATSKVIGITFCSLIKCQHVVG